MIVPMKICRFCLAFGLLLVALPALAAEAGIVTIADGAARVLRGTIWYRLVAGAPFQEGDLIDAGDRTQVQLELTGGATVHVVGPATLFAASVPMRSDKADGAAEFALDKGWMKVASPANAALRMRMPAALVNVGQAIFVARQDGKSFELFVESGSVRIAETNRTSRDGAVHDAKSGEYWSRDGDKPFVTEHRAPPQFVSAMPHHLMDRLASLTARFAGKKPTLVVDREITLAEADPWLAGPYRRTFARRLSGRLADPAFRKGVEANIAAYPDFDRILHPEKYPPSQTGATTGPGVPAAPAPAQAPPQKPGQRSARVSITIVAAALAPRS
ncbi:MAG TPA: hypothetical protein VGK44_10745 [Casimicrobiaceae bacterium]|jgi:hypothetical protein